MLKKLLPLVFLPLLMGGCTATFTNLTPTQQVRTTNNLYTVEVAMTSRQATLLWNTIKPQIVVGDQFYPMTPTPLMTNRWEGQVPVPAGDNVVHYHYKFDYMENAFGAPQPASASSQEYTLKILEQ
jgi:hypothetical protein